MRRFPSRVFTALTLACACAPCAANAQPRGTFTLQAEDAALSGVQIETRRAGFAGKGYVSGLDADGDKLSWTLPKVAPGIYEVRLRYSSPFGDKGYELVVNNAQTSGALPQTGETFATIGAGKIELRAGTNSIAIEKGWGYYDVDALELRPATIAPTRQPPFALSNPNASVEAREVMRFLHGNYGRKTLSGQQEREGVAYVREVSGQTPAVFGGDLMDYSPSRVEFGAKPQGTTERLIQAARDGHILTLSWHWNAPSGLRNATYTDAQGKVVEAPWWRGFYSDATTFDVQRALSNPKSRDYALLLRDIDAIAVELKKLQAARVPVLWRPLHEAEGGWFWWGARGPEPFKTLWRLAFDRLTRHHKLHNLVWVYTSAGKLDWYPGDATVDIVGTDAYLPIGDPLSALWDDLSAKFGRRKMLALTEIGGVPDIAKMSRFGVHPSYFMSWEGAQHGPATAPRELVLRTYHDARVLNREALPLRLQPLKTTAR